MSDLKKKAKELPTVIFVIRHKEAANDDDAILLATEDESCEEFDDGDVVGVYQLMKVKTKHVTHTIE